MDMSSNYRVATDVGGTFTDFVGIEVQDGVRRVVTAKSDSTPPNFADGVLDVIKKSGVSPADIATLSHGSTVIINALTERKGARVGLITTMGFRDVLEIARGDRPNYFDLFYQKPAPFVPRYLCCEIEERVDYKGNIVKPLNLDRLDGILDHFRSEGVEAIAISFLHAYAYPDHEMKVAAEIGKRAPEFYVSCAHEISREWREYERANTSVLSAYVKPVADRYLESLKSSLEERGYSNPIYVMQSNCGINTYDRARETPITMVESGPSSGVWGAAEIGKLIGTPNVIALDIGGTTAKCSLIQDGQVRITSDYWIERTRTTSGYPIMVPVVDIVEIGNGGGSIAWVDDYGKMHVGPKSSGANPGPAAYGKGGTDATTTDANIYLGRINKDFFCGGEIDADIAAVERALARLGDRMSMSPADVARGIVRIANHNMTNALKLISLNRGHDPRDFTLVAFGGGGGMHAVTLARELGISKVVIPANAAVFSALGMLLSDIRRDYIETIMSDFVEASLKTINKKITDISKRAAEEFASDGIAAEKADLTFQARLRYRNQEHFVEVKIPQHLDECSLRTVSDSFHETYEREYTYRLNSPIEIVAIHCIAVSREESNLLVNSGGDHPVTAEPVGERKVDFDEFGLKTAQIFRGEKLKSNVRVDGPAVIEESGTTIVVFPGDRMLKDGFGNYQIDVGDQHDG
jgi:N-methylhydantoinase A